jgi:hypothetical protein
MKILTLIFFLIFFTSCSKKETAKEIDLQQPEFSFENILGYGKTDTLFIKSRFEDCGEWGGHEELIKIYRSERKPKLTYVKFKVDCGVRNSLGSIIQTKQFTRHILLSNSQQLILMKYMTDLMKFQFLKEEISHSGNSFYVSNTKGDLRISHYGNQPLLLNSYNTLMTALKLQKVIIENK